MSWQSLNLQLLYLGTRLVIANFRKFCLQLLIQVIDTFIKIRNKQESANLKVYLSIDRVDTSIKCQMNDHDDYLSDQDLDLY